MHIRNYMCKYLMSFASFALHIPRKKKEKEIRYGSLHIFVPLIKLKNRLEVDITSLTVGQRLPVNFTVNINVVHL